ADWLPKIVECVYDPRALPIVAKTSALIGMGMTERQGGSDVRANITRAERTDDGSYRLSGHKWFFSAPMCDAHLVLAQADVGLSCFFLPRLLPDGSRNAVRIERLKDKLGNRSNASSEVEFDGATAWLLGDEGRGVPVIIEMVQHTRLDCAIGSAGIVRAAAAQALHHAAHRRAFGKRLADHALMQNVLCDLALAAERARARGGNAQLDEHAARIVSELRDEPNEYRGRSIANMVARTLAAAQIVRHAPNAIADAYCASRLAHRCEGAFGMLDGPTD